METKTITIQRTFDFPAHIAWKAWSEQEYIQQWWAPKNYVCTDCTVDFRVGGKYLFAMQDKKGGPKIWSTGVYEEIIPNIRIVMTDSFSDSNGSIISGNDIGMPGDWPEVLLLTAEFQEHEGKTLFLLKHEGIPPEAYEDCVQGWQECLDKMNELKIKVPS